MLIACGAESDGDDPAAETMLSEYSENVSIIKSENGRRSLIFTAPLVEGYTFGSVPYREFREGIRVVTYNNDSLSTVDVILEADYAIFYEKNQLWEARGNVVVRKMNESRTTLYTQQLFWNVDAKRVYSNVDSKLVENGGRDVAYGEGFESDDRLEFPRWRKGRGMMTVNVAEMKNRREEDDSLRSEKFDRSGDVSIANSRPPVGKVGTQPGSSNDERRPSAVRGSSSRRSGQQPRPAIERDSLRREAERRERMRRSVANPVLEENEAADRLLKVERENIIVE